MRVKSDVVQYSFEITSSHYEKESLYKLLGYPDSRLKYYSMKSHLIAGSMPRALTIVPMLSLRRTHILLTSCRLASIAILLFSAFCAEGQIYTFANAASGAPGSVAVHATGTNLVFGSGVDAGDCGVAEGFGADGWPNSGVNIATSNTSGDYVQFSITPDAGYALNITGFTANLRRDDPSGSTNDGPTIVRYAYSVNNISWTDNGANLTPNNTSTCSNTGTANAWAAFTPVYSAGTVIFRIYGFSSGSTGAGDLNIRNLVVSGAVVVNGNSVTLSMSSIFVVPPGVTNLKVELWGGGGGAGSGNSGSGARSGGGGGAYAKSILTVVPGATYSVIIGTGGVQGSNGTNSSFGTTLVVAAGGATPASTDVGGIGGTVAASTGAVRFSGGSGGVRQSSNSAGGGGGGSATGAGNGGNGINGSAGLGGAGGSGQGNGGHGGNTGAVGLNGITPGGGGGGKGDSGANSGSGANGTATMAWCTDGPAAPLLSVSPDPFCTGQLVTLTINGDLNGATQWAIYTGACGGTLLGTTTTPTFLIAPASTTTYFVRGEGCISPGACAQITVHLDSSVPGCTTPASPSNSQTNVSVSATLNWMAATCTSGYKLYFGTNNPPTNLVNGANVGTVLSYDPPGLMNILTTYYWKIVPYNSNGDATGCAVWSFKTNDGSPQCTTPEYPSDGAIGIPTYADLFWHPAIDATGYKLYFGTNNPPTNLVNGTNLGNVLTYDAGTLLVNTQYYWRIAPANSFGDASGCAVSTFITWDQACQNSSNPTFCTSCSSCAEPIGDNPDLTGSCADLRIALVVDESGSISGYDQDVKNGVMAFVSALACTGAELSVVEFNDAARYVLNGYQEVDNNLVTAMQNYFDNINNPLLVGNADYSPSGYTNYQAALMAVDALPITPNLMLFFTDGVPTSVYLTNPPPAFTTNGSTSCGNTTSVDSAEINNPAKIANKLKCEGAHVFMLGVGSVTVNSLQQLSGTTIHSMSNTIATADYALEDYPNLAQCLAMFVSELCPFSSQVLVSDICEGSTNGSISISVPPVLFPYTYSYFDNSTDVLLGTGSNISMTPLIVSGLGVGEYRIEVQVTLPGSGCTRTETFFGTITEGAVGVSIEFNELTDPICFFPDDGSVQLLFTAGEAPFEITLKENGIPVPGYPVSTFSNPYPLTGLHGGAYTVVVADVNQCNEDSIGFILNVPENCCPQSCALTSGPDDAVCPGSQSFFGVDIQDCNDPVYYWTIINNTSGAAINGPWDEATVVVDAVTCGEYTIRAMVWCGTCDTLICEQTVFVQDDISPEITGCPADITVDCIEEIPLPDIGSITWIDNCETAAEVTWVSDVSDGHLCPQVITRTYRVTDVCGNWAACTQHLVIFDTTAPLIECPADVTVTCTAGVPQPDPVSITVSDNCQTTSLVTWVLDVSDGNLCPEIITRTYRATDMCGNATTCTQHITIFDTTAPEIACPGDVTVECREDVPVPDAQLVEASDHCSAPVTVTWLGDDSDGHSCPELVIRTYRAEDACGNRVSCTQRITIDDRTPPMIVTCAVTRTIEGCDVGDISGPVYSETPASSSVAEFEGVANQGIASDNCGIVSVTYVDQSGGSCPIVVTRTWTLWDACGNHTSCHQTINIDDTTPPTIAGHTISVQCLSEAFDSIGALAGIVASDGCSVPVLEPYFVGTSGPCPTYVSVYFRATDACLNSASWTQTIIVDDTTPPMITCPHDTTYQCIEDVPSVEDDISRSRVSDNCTSVLDLVVTFVHSTTAGSCPTTIKRVYRVEDACGNTQSCTHTITVFDTTPPELVCTDNMTIEWPEHEVNLAAALAAVMAQFNIWMAGFSATDNCTVPLQTTIDVQTIAGCEDIGAFTPFIKVVRYRAEDACGNSASCTRIFTVVDTTPPDITCPADITIACTENIEPDHTGFATATDGNDSLPEITWSDVSTRGVDVHQCSCYNYHITRTWYARDNCFNLRSCTQHIDVEDTTSPELSCPAPVFAECAGDVPEPSPGSLFAGDNCAVDIAVTWVRDISDGNQCPLVITRTYRASDVCGNVATCTQHIEVFDRTPPGIACPGNVVVECIDEVPAPDLLSVSVSDNCSAGTTVTWVRDVQDGDQCPVVITRTYKATDACGNHATCTQYILIHDVTPPEIACPADTIVSCIQELPDPDPSVLVVSDNCSAETETIWVRDVSDGSHCPQIITRTYGATDACGNQTTCTQHILIYDMTPPVIACPQDVVVECIDEVPEADVQTVVWHDNCTAESDVTWVGDVSDMAHCPEIITRTYRVTDACGNHVTCIQYITIQDHTPPVIACPGDLEVECMEEVPVPDIATISWSDNCAIGGEVRWVQDVSDGNHCPEVITRTYRATDGCGNQATCTQHILIRDITPPVIECPGDVAVECIEEVPVPEPFSVSAMDNCDGGTAVTWVRDISDGRHCPEVITRTYRATDACGNQVSCTQKIEVYDTTPPFIVCPADTLIECQETIPVPDPSLVIVSDNCVAGLYVTWIGDVSDGNRCPEVITRRYRATDACRNTATCVQKITIADTTAPVIGGIPDVTIACGSALPATGATVFDACDLNASIMNITENESIADCPRMILRTYSAMDACGNTSVYTQHIYIVDTIGPVLICPDDVTIECGTALPMTQPQASDCSGVMSVTHSDSSPSGGSCNRTITRTFTATDLCGNTAHCVQYIHIVDTTPPVVDCEDLSFECIEKTCLTFDDIPVNPFAPPVIISNINIAGITINVKAYKKGSTAPIQAALFNTGNPHPNDLDLGTPNILYGGPGISGESPDGYNASNNRPAGKAVIVQTPGAPVADDYLIGDSLVFTFSKPVFLESLLAIDIELPQVNTGAGIFIYGVNGNFIRFIPFSTPPGQDNNLDELLLETNDVKKMKIYFGSTIPSSGAIARICFVPIPDPAVTDCSAVQLSYSDTSSEPDNCTTEIIRTYYAADACGNSAPPCVEQITIHTDVEGPDIICPADITIGCDDPLPPPNVNDLVVTDNCNLPGTTVEWLMDITEGSQCNSVVRRIYRAVGGCGNIARCVQFITREERVHLTGKVFLAGPYSAAGDSMNTQINSLLPHAQPYAGAPYNYGGAESVATIPADIVDWILVDLCDKVTRNLVARRAALLTAAGNIVDLDGVSQLAFFATPDLYYVAIHHRNHLDIISDTPVNFNSGTGMIDFTLGNSGSVVVEPGVFAMYAGDVNADQLVKYNGANNDKNAILSAVGMLTPNNILSNVYHVADVNMDGLVKYNGANNDKNAVLNTVGLLTPNHIVTGQLY